MKKKSFPVLFRITLIILALTIYIFATGCQYKFETKTEPECSRDWKITGYFTPVESDYSGESKQINIDEEKRTFNKAFLDTIKEEGWGRTNAGDYIGWHDNSWHISDQALDSLGNELTTESVAVDTSIITPRASITLPTLPAPYNNIIFIATDIGPSIAGKHIDVFTGEGAEAEQETFTITGNGHTVCVE
nr:murein transglycosylase [Nanoarchaeota archaeon]